MRKHMDTVRTIFILAAAIFVAFVAWQIFHFVLWLVTMLVTVAIVGAVLYLAFFAVRSSRRSKATSKAR